MLSKAQFLARAGARCQYLKMLYAVVFIRFRFLNCTDFLAMDWVLVSQLPHKAANHHQHYVTLTCFNASLTLLMVYFPSVVLLLINGPSLLDYRCIRG